MAGETSEPTPTGREGVTGRDFGVDRETITGILTILPVLALYLMIAVFPIVFALLASLHDIPSLNPEWTFVGLENYYEVLEIETIMSGDFGAIFEPATFWSAMLRGAIYMVGSTLIQLSVGLWMALVLNRITRGQKLLTAVVFTAYLIPTVILSLVALRMFEPGAGLMTDMGARLGLWDMGVDVFRGSQTWAMPMLILVGSWKFSVFITIFALAQLRAIPSRFYEAAKVCGANRLQMFRDVTLPRIAGVILVAVLLRSIFMFNKFDIIWQLTQGGPGVATETLPILAYEELTTGNFGEANAVAVVMFLFLLIAALGYLMVFNPSEEVETTA